MIENTFLHLPRVGEVLERRLWAAGFHTWYDLWDALNSGRSARECVRHLRQRTLFPSEPNRENSLDQLTLSWIEELDRSKVAFESRDINYFLRRLRPSSHWRLLPQVCDNALFLDIETTGLSREHHYITVIGVIHRGIFHQWTWPQETSKLGQLIKQASAVITFNGARFDLPFLARQIPSLPPVRAHIDLRYIAQAAALPGGQKEVEKHLGLSRTKVVQAFDGENAVFAWCASLYGNRADYDTLLKYNKADVKALPCLCKHLYDLLAKQAPAQTSNAVSIRRAIRSGHLPLSHDLLIREWQSRMPSYQRLRKCLPSKPVVVGIDLRANPSRPTGWVVCRGSHAKTRVLYSDKEILESTLKAKPDLVSIDAPLSLPNGRITVSDDSPCRQIGGIVREAERILWSRHIRVYPALIRQMQGLTSRGIALARELESQGIKVIESYPGAAQDVLNIPRKKGDQKLLAEGLRQFGYRFPEVLSHDELDALTSSLVGHFYLAGRYEAIGADQEGYMINPRIDNMGWDGAGPANVQAIFFVGLPGAGKSSVVKQLSTRLGWAPLLLGNELRERAVKSSSLETKLSSGQMAPEALVQEILSAALSGGLGQQILVDGYPRYPSQLELLIQSSIDWCICFLDVTMANANRRLEMRRICESCGHIGSSASSSRCPVCASSEWTAREDDSPAILSTRIHSQQKNLAQMLVSVPHKRLLTIDANAKPQVVCANVMLAVESFMSTEC